MRFGQTLWRVVLGMVVAGTGWGARAADAPRSPDDVFAPGRVHTIHLAISPQGWAMMQPEAAAAARRRKPAAARHNGGSTPGPSTRPAYVDGDPLPPGPGGFTFAYARCRVEFDGEAVADVGVRFKGNISYLVSAGSPRRSMKLDFDRFVDKRHFAGLATLNLNNFAFDPSFAREPLAFALFRDLGVPAPRTGYALVYLSVPGTYDRELLGLYALIEEVDHRFLKRHFADAGGLLLKPERMRGLACFGEQWGPAYAARYNPKGDVAPEWARRVVELARLVDRADDATFRERIALYLDVDEVLRYVAVNSVIVNPDSFLSTGHNYYLYVDPGDGRARFVPWDMNLSFGGYSWVASPGQSVRTSVTRAYVDHNRLIERLLGIDEYARAYRRHVARLADELLSPARVGGWRADLAPVLEASARAAREAGKAGAPATRPVAGQKLVAPELWPFVAARAEAVRAQLAGRDEGFRPGFRDPRLVPDHMAPYAAGAVAIMAGVDADGDELLTDAEVAAAARRLMTSAGAATGGTLDLAQAARAIDALRPGAGRAWAAWMFRVADSNGDGRLTDAEMVGAYRRLLAGVDRDYDGMMCGREVVEALAGAGAPR